MDIQERYYDNRKGCVIFKSDFDSRVKVNSLKKARSVEYETFLNFYTNLETSMKNGHPVETISREKNSLARQFDEVKRKHSEFCVVCPDIDERAHKQWLNVLIYQFSKANSGSDTYVQNVITDSKRAEIT